ncbi:MAG: 16S rRNA (cytosine(967)-C(5))-methyltransferase RsmB, partial [Oscillospiraceae bacterium]
MTTARQVAVEALLGVNTKGGYSNLVLNNELKQAKLTPQDNAFASVLFYGVLERKLTLDHYIMHYTKKPMNKLTPAVVEILRTAFYQLMYMENIPPSAVVNESVTLTRVNRCSSASGFVNGVLRAFIRDDKKPVPVKGGEIAVMSVGYSCPEWIIKLLINDYGKESTLKILQSFFGRKTLYARVNTVKTTTEQIINLFDKKEIAAKADLLQNCISLNGTGSIEKLGIYKRGLFHIQDKACQLALECLSPKSGERILDACSAPGSKSFTMAEYMNNTGEIVACDIYPHKLPLIEDGAKRLGINIIKPILQDSTVFNESLGEFDKVLCDVPCSGLGIMGKKPEIRYKEQAEIQKIDELQYKILENSSKYCKVGGIVMYSTCTLNKAENQAVAEKFIAEHTEF